MVFWTLATWIITPILIVSLGFNGVAIASALISLSFIIVIAITRRYFDFNVINATFYPLVGSVVMGIAIYFMGQILAKSVLGLLLVICFGAMIYFLTSFALGRKQIKKDLMFIKQNLRQ